MHPDQRALLNAIIAEPERDDLRLIYADWLEENDGVTECANCKGNGFYLFTPRQRVECRFCSGTGNSTHGFAARAAKIREQFKQSPFRHMTAIGGTPGLQNHIACEWERGFIRDVVCIMDQWLQYGPAICDEHPVERVVITDKSPHDSPLGWTYYGIDGGGFDRMHVPDFIQKEPRPARYFPSAEAANADLSAKCIAWAREQAATMQSASPQCD